VDDTFHFSVDMPRGFRTCRQHGSALNPRKWVSLSIWNESRKEALIMDTSVLVRTVAGVLAVAVLSVIVIRRKQKAS
jgi:hypothetical protein